MYLRCIKNHLVNTVSLEGASKASSLYLKPHEEHSHYFMLPI